VKKLVALVVLLLVLSPVTASASYPGYRFSGAIDRWTSLACDNPHGSEVILYSDTGQSGPQVRLCSNQSNFCVVPLGADDSPTGPCSDFVPNEWANDKISSGTVVSLQNGVCMKLYSDTGYGSLLTSKSVLGGFNLLGGFGDSASSMKFVSC
jgi:hypothetical protein